MGLFKAIINCVQLLISISMEKILCTEILVHYNLQSHKMFHFTNKDLTSQSCGFSSSHVWM